MRESIDHGAERVAGSERPHHFDRDLPLAYFGQDLGGLRRAMKRARENPRQVALEANDAAGSQPRAADSPRRQRTQGVVRPMLWVTLARRPVPEEDHSHLVLSLQGLNARRAERPKSVRSKKITLGPLKRATPHRSLRVSTCAAAFCVNLKSRRRFTAVGSSRP